MGTTNFSGLSVMNAPIFPGILSQINDVRRPIPGSRIVWVGSGAAAAAGGGGGDGVYTATTLGGSSGGLSQLAGRTNQGDIIYVMPGHTESVSSADYFSDTGAASGFSVIGLGTGTQRATFNWTAAASTWLLDTAGVEVANLILNFAVTAATVVVTPITVSAASCRMVGNFINWGASTTVGCGSTLGAIALTTAADYFEFIGNFCLNLDVAGTTGQAITLLSVNGGDYLRVIGNKIFGATTATTVGPIHFLTTLSSDVEIVGNYIENLIASSTIAISSAIAGVTGTIAFNQLRVNSGIQPITVSSNISCTLYENRCSNTVNKAGANVVGAGVSA